MNKREQAERLSRLMDLAKSLKGRRYRVAIACGEISSGKSGIAQAAGRQLPARYVDLEDDLMPRMTLPDFSPTLGAFGPDNLAEWIMHQADQPEVHFLVVDQIEPLLATFGRTQAVSFFSMMSRAEPRRPVILVTYLKKQIQEAVFSTERILYL
jgi:hypothetical protein